MENALKNNMKITGVYEFGHFGIWDNRRSIYLHHDKLSDLLYRLKIDSIILSSGFLFKNHTNSKDKFLKMISEITKRYHKNGIKVGIHPHAGTSIFTRDDIDYVLEGQKEHISLVPDLNHLRKAQVNPYDLFKVYKDHISEFHITGSEQELDFLSFLSREMYHQKLTLEVDRVESNAKVVLQNSLNNIDNLFYKHNKKRR
ncbi:sugar phosphate isomerase/epimerase [Bacillus sp. SM2101]|uniref:sugar phosphate isomerase/epimerase family protein n=1 Tax=Bacillus sp. SM2101 TaxID=2805366 RepID=UPI002032A3D7|nr:sugar phosphate isomerase/epimerase [Bacillus sp. SM2101]